MAVEYRIDHEKRFVTVSARGPVGLQDLLDMSDAFVVQNAMGYPKLLDAREAWSCLSDDEMMMLGARVSAYAVHDPRGPIAAVTMDRESSTFFQRFMNLGGGERPVRLFGTIEEARRWLGQEE